MDRGVRLNHLRITLRDSGSCGLVQQPHPRGNSEMISDDKESMMVHTIPESYGADALRNMVLSPKESLHATWPCYKLECIFVGKTGLGVYDINAMNDGAQMAWLDRC